MPLKIDGELIVNAPRVLGVTSGLIPTAPGMGLAGVTTVDSHIPAQNANTTLAVANPNRVGLSICNNSAANLFVKLGATANIGAGTESFTKKIPPGLYWEIPFGYTGRVDAIWDAVDVNGEALVVLSVTGLLAPNLLPGLMDWHRADASDVTLVAGDVSVWTDKSGGGNTLNQTVAARRYHYTANGIGGRPMLDPGALLDDRFMSWTPWSCPARGTTIMVVMYRTSGANYQSGIFCDAGFSGMYLGGAGGSLNKPLLFINADEAVNSLLGNNTAHFIKWAWDEITETAFTQVDNNAEVVDVAPAFTASDKFFRTLGMDPAVTASQDILSGVAEKFTFSRTLTQSEYTAMYAYGRDFYSNAF